MTQEVLKLALEALENGDVPTPENAGKNLDAITAIKEALAQEQEPVAWGTDWGRAGDIPCVSIIKRLPNGGIQVLAVEYAPYNYTTPPQRTWVGLTDEEFDDLRDNNFGVSPLISAVEAKLKELNG